jgi:transcriptional regulator with XRE-family HTH domain
MSGPIQSREHEVLGNAVREARARRGLSQERLGALAGLHRNYVGAIERGEINPTFRVLQKLGDGLRMELSELFALYESRRDDPPRRQRRRRRRARERT